MLLFTVGPVMMHEETLGISGTQLPYFRTDDFSEIMLESERLLKKLLNAPDSSKVAFLTASGTGAMDAVVSQCFGPDDRLLIVNGGSFGHRFVELAEHYSVPYESIDLGLGEALTPDHLKRYSGKGYTAMLINMDETSTGQLYNMKRVSDFCKKEGMYLITDAISAFLADSLDMSDGMDAVILSSQKALALSPGISIIVLSPRLYEERVSKRKSVSYYLDLKSHIDNQVRGQTPFTPAVGILLELHARLKSIDADGVDACIRKTAELASYFRKKAKEIGLRIPDYPLSNAVTPILMDDGAYDLFLRLKEKDIYVTPSGGALRDKIIRVGHIGNLDFKDYDILIDAIKKAI